MPLGTREEAVLICIDNEGMMKALSTVIMRKAERRNQRNIGVTNTRLQNA